MRKTKVLTFLSIMVMSVILPMTAIRAASYSFSFNFDRREVSGDANGIHYSIPANKKVTASGTWHLEKNQES